MGGTKKQQGGRKCAQTAAKEAAHWWDANSILMRSTRMSKTAPEEVEYEVVDANNWLP